MVSHINSFVKTCFESGSSDEIGIRITCTSKPHALGLGKITMENYFFGEVGLVYRQAYSLNSISEATMLQEAYERLKRNLGGEYSLRKEQKDHSLLTIISRSKIR